MQPSAYNPSATSTSRKPLPLSTKNANDVPSPMSCPRPIPSILQPIRRIQLPPTGDKIAAAADSSRNEHLSVRISAAPWKAEKKRSDSPAPPSGAAPGTSAFHLSKAAGGAGITARDMHSGAKSVSPNQSYAGKKHAHDGYGGREEEAGHVKKKAKVHHDGSEKENRAPSGSQSVHKKSEHGKKGKEQCSGHERNDSVVERNGSDTNGGDLMGREHVSEEEGRKDDEGDGVPRCCFCGEHGSNKVSVGGHIYNLTTNPRLTTSQQQWGLVQVMGDHESDEMNGG